MWLQWIQAPTPGLLLHKGQALHFSAVVLVPGPLSLALGQIPAPGCSGCQGQYQEQETIAAGYRNLFRGRLPLVPAPSGSARVKGVSLACLRPTRVCPACSVPPRPPNVPGEWLPGSLGLGRWGCLGWVGLFGAGGVARPWPWLGCEERSDGFWLGLYLCGSCSALH